MRVYGFKKEEIVNEEHKNLDLALDPKIGWALRNLNIFPLDVNKADKTLLLRVPGIGFKSVEKILAARRFRALTFDHLKQMGVIVSRAKYFIVCAEHSDTLTMGELSSEKLRGILLKQQQSKYTPVLTPQLSIFDQPLITEMPLPALDLNQIFFQISNEQA